MPSLASRPVLRHCRETEVTWRRHVVLSLPFHHTSKRARCTAPVLPALYSSLQGAHPNSTLHTDPRQRFVNTFFHSFFVLRVPKRIYVGERFHFAFPKAATFRFGGFCMPATSVCFWTPRLSLGHPGSFTSVDYLQRMCTQRATLCPKNTYSGLGMGEPTTLRSEVWRAIH